MENFSLQKVVFSGQRIGASFPEKMLDLVGHLQLPYVFPEAFLRVRDLRPIHFKIMELVKEFITRLYRIAARFFYSPNQSVGLWGRT